MTNLLHRLLRGRHQPDEDEPVAALAPFDTASEAGKDAADSTTELPQAKSAPLGRGPRKTRDEVSSIGPGEP
jgi:hypothetical protein